MLNRSPIPSSSSTFFLFYLFLLTSSSSIVPSADISRLPIVVVSRHVPVQEFYPDSLSEYTLKALEKCVCYQLLEKSYEQKLYARERNTPLFKMDFFIKVTSMSQVERKLVVQRQQDVE